MTNFRNYILVLSLIDIPAHSRLTIFAHTRNEQNRPCNVRFITKVDFSFLNNMLSFISIPGMAIMHRRLVLALSAIQLDLAYFLVLIL